MEGATPYGPPIFRRVLLKLSGESFCRPGEGGISVDEVSRIARQASRVAACGVELAIVVGGGNILRGATLSRGADVMKEATAVDGVYSADPEKNPHAVRYEHLTYDQVLRDDLKVMDMTAIGMCLDNGLPILVFNFKKEGNIERAIAGETIGTWISNTPRPLK